MSGAETKRDSRRPNDLIDSGSWPGYMYVDRGRNL
jgi:hypothetical protein